MSRSRTSAVLLLLAALGLVVTLTVANDPPAEPVNVETVTQKAPLPPPVLRPARTSVCGLSCTAICDSACVRWVSVTLWRAALADGPPIGCPNSECYRGGIRAKRPCAIPDYICDRESDYWIDVGNPGSSAAGKYQFVIRTWEYAATGAGYPEWADRSAGYAPEYVQDAAARWLWARGAGAGHWACC